MKQLLSLLSLMLFVAVGTTSCTQGDKPSPDEIWYTTTDGNIVYPKLGALGSHIISNTYSNGKGVIIVEGDCIEKIGEEAFSGCSSLTSITIPDSVTSIGSSAFKNCYSLTSITIPDSVTEIGGSAFSGCTSLISVYITNIAAWCRISFGDDSANPLYYAHNLYLNGELVTDLIIPDSVTSIGQFAFSGCRSLTSVTIPDNITSIGDGAFKYCSSLTSVTMGNSVTSIGDYAFSGCTSLTSIIIPDSVTWIGDEAFNRCSSLTSVTIPDSVTSIGESAFWDCESLTSVYITDIAAWCRISFGNVWANPFFYAHNLYLNGELVTDLIIPSSVTSIGRSAFWGCSSLTSVTIPDSVTSIGYEAFHGCTSLTKVYCKPTTPPRGYYYMFYDNASGRKIYVPRGSVNTYKNAKNWSEYADAIVGYDF